MRSSRSIRVKDERRGNPAAKVTPQLVRVAWWSARIKQERLNYSQHMFGEFIEGGLIEAVCSPIDFEAVEHRFGELDGNVGGDLGAKGVRSSGSQE